MRFFVVLVTVAVAVWFLRRVVGVSLSDFKLFSQPKPIFRMDFTDGHLDQSDGPIPGRMYRELTEVARISKTTGTINYFGPGEYRFSDNMPDGICQRFRNVLALSYKIPPTPG